jgi:hypothetical protein
MHLRHPVIAIATFMIAVVLTSESGASPQTHSEQATNATTNLGGRYRIFGTNPDGGEYNGSLDVIARGGVYQFRWNAGTQYDGVGVRNGRIVAVAFANGSDGTGCGVVDYTVLNDGTLEGRWGYWGTSASGTERARHVSGRGLEGGYAATGTNPDGKRYQVNISVQAAGRGYKFAWSNKSAGFGIKRGDNVAVGIGGERCGFVAYEIKSDGSLDGIWGGYGSQQTGTEKATKQ